MQPIPVTILAGSDRKPGTLPESGRDLHSLSDYKGLAVRIAGRPLIERLVEHLGSVPGFGPIHVAGPARVFAPQGLEARLIDTDGSVGANLRAAVEAHARSGGGMMAVIACDVLPTVEELIELRARFEQALPCALWCPFVRVPVDPARLGVFGWKPTYGVVPAAGAEAIRILPGHLCIFDPEALRLPLLYRLMDSAYRTRNRPVTYRRTVMLRTTLLSLLAQDVLLLLRLRLPDRTLSTVRSGLQLARDLHRGALQLPELERLIGRIFLRTQVTPAHGVRYPIVDILSLAEDIDTEEEANQLARRAEAR